jgi:GTP-binding protein
MKKIEFKSAKFIESFASTSTKCPDLLGKDGKPVPEIALVGKSNVGKSSLINHLLSNRNLARTSSLPGKTRLVNFFLIDDLLGLVDLPGYGYAKASKQEQADWGQAIDRYLSERETLRLLLLLIDARRLPAEEDLAIVEWAQHRERQVLVVFTKTDTLSQGEIEKNIAASLETLPFLPHTLYTIRDGASRKKLIHTINELL